SPLARGGYFKPGYVNGMSAGSLSVTAVNPILEGDLATDIVIGAHQRALAQSGTDTDGAQATPDQLPNGASLTITLATGGDKIGPFDTVVLVSSVPDVLGPGFTIDTALVLPTRTDGGWVVTYATDRLSAYGLGSISIGGADTLSMADGA